MKRLGYLLVLGWGLLGWPQTAQAQTLPLPLPRLRVLRDSLTDLLAREPRPDTLRVQRLNTLGFALRINDPPRARALARQALALAGQLRYAPGLMEAHFTLGYDYRARNQYDSALFHSRQALTWATRTRNPLTQSRAYYNLCRIYTEQGDYAAALGPSLDGLALARALHRPQVEALQLVQASRVELGLGELTLARQYVEEARNLLPAVQDSVCTAVVYQGLGDIDRRQGRWQAAHRAYTRTLRAYRTIYTERGLLPVELLLAEMRAQLTDEATVRPTAWQLLARARRLQMPEQTAGAALLLARSWQTTRPDSARTYAALSLSAAAGHRLLPLAHDAAQLLARASGQLGDFRRAYEYQAQAAAFADTLSGEDTRRRLSAAQARALRSRTQLQLDVLRQQQELERLRHQQQVAGLLALLALTALVVVGLVWSFRRRQARREAALRTRLAADLHDDVGNLLTQVSMQADLLQEISPAADAPAQARLRRLSETSRRARREMTDVVWGLQTPLLTLPALLTRLRDHAYEVLPAAELTVDFDVTDAGPEQALPPLLGQHLYLIYKEALHNVVKHARHATHVQVRVARHEGQLHLRVQDNGQPAPASAAGEPASARSGGGNGLRNMRRRAEALGGTLYAAPGPAGFRLEARLPAP
jgi:signal transduction histidine kinase